MKFASFLYMWIMCSLLYGIICDEDVNLLNDKTDLLQIRVNVIEQQMSIDKMDLLNKQDIKILSLKTELKTKLRKHVTDALSDILRGESFEDMIKSKVLSEVRHLQRTNHQMRRELHQLKTFLGKVQEDNRIYREALQKGERENSDLMTCSKYLVKSELELAESNRKISELNQKIKEQQDMCTSLNNTNNKEIETDAVFECSKCLYSEVMTNRLIKYDHQISELNQALIAKNKLCNDSKNTGNEETNSASETTAQISTVSLTTAAGTTTPTTRLTTSEPRPERSRILIAPLWSSSYHQLSQLSINSNSIDIYSFLNLKNVESLLYISKLNSLLVGLNSPHKIVSSTLHSTTIRTVTHNVRTYGMAADEKIGVVFLTTNRPSRIISRMSLQGKHFTALVSLSGYGAYPLGITVYPERKVIYACNEYKLFTVRYDGSGLTTLNTGNYIAAVTLDINHGLLYYGKEKKLMKMSLSTNTSSELLEFNFKIWNIIYYRDTVYYISRFKSPGILGAVDVGQNIVSYTLQNVKVSSIDDFAICLIP